MAKRLHALAEYKGLIPLGLLEDVLSDLSPAELQDYKTLRTLLEPFLLDALKQSGRESPHDAKSDEKVEMLCRKIFEELSAKEVEARSCKFNEGDAWTSALRCALETLGSAAQAIPEDVVRESQGYFG
eukprot:symbB.v1.2.008366.t1/scaffold524.1/size192337/15